MELDLLNLILKLQEVMGRSEALVINALKTVFTRLSRAETKQKLRELGVYSDVFSTSFELLNVIANIYDDLTPNQKNAIAELLGGVYQINLVKMIFSVLNTSTRIISDDEKYAPTDNNFFPKNNC